MHWELEYNNSNIKSVKKLEIEGYKSFNLYTSLHNLREVLKTEWWKLGLPQKSSTPLTATLSNIYIMGTICASSNEKFKKSNVRPFLFIPVSPSRIEQHRYKECSILRVQDI